MTFRKLVYKKLRDSIFQSGSQNGGVSFTSQELGPKSQANQSDSKHWERQRKLKEPQDFKLTYNTCNTLTRRSRVKISANQSTLPSVLFLNLLSAVG